MSNRMAYPSTTPGDDFKVIIIGGSIAGLTLAHALNHINIDYIVLEAHKEIAPQVGASIGIFSNGARILDQLGVWEDVENAIEPCVMGHNRIGPKAKYLFGTDFPRLFEKRHGYPMAFLDRQQLLQFLYDRLPDKSKVRLGKRVNKIQLSDSGVNVFTTDGDEFSGHLAAGADGVHSVTRSEMWRNADLLQPNLISDEEKSAMFAEYCCIYGISNPIKGMNKGEGDFVLNDLFSHLVVTSKGGRNYWFLFKKLDRKYYVPNIPRFTAEDTERLAVELGHTHIHPDVPFSKLWEERVCATMTPLEENVFRTWHFGRIVCLGDAMHKLTPNLGQGGNSAIESAAVLANALYHHRCTASNHSYASALSEYAHLRIPRTTEIHSIASWVTRVQARDGFRNRIFGKYIARYAGDVPLNVQSSFIVTAPSLDYLPEPERTKECWMPFDDTLPERPTPWKRFVNTGWVFIPFLMGAYWYPTVSPTAVSSSSSTAMKAANFISTTLLLLESNRRGNIFSPANLAPLFIGFSSWGASSSSFRLPLPLYHLLHYCFLSPFSYLSLDQRSVTYHHALTTPLTALATVFLGNWTALTPLHSILAYPFRQRARRQRLEKPLDDIPVLAVVYGIVMVAAVVEGGFGKRVDCEEVSAVVWAALGAWEAGGRAWGGFVGMMVAAGGGWPWVAVVVGAAWREWALVGMRR